MGRHRSRDESTTRRRGFARWPIFTVAAVALLLASWLGWVWLSGVMDRRAAAQAQDCAQGSSMLKVAVAPSVEVPVKAAAKRWNDRKTVVYEHCVRIAVAAIDSNQVLSGLTHHWNESQIGTRPQAWLPESSLWTNRLGATDNALLGSAPASVASSPVVLAMPEDGANAIAGARGLSWSDLPGVLGAQNGWASYGHKDWGRFTIALPDPAANPASGLAIQGALAAVAGQANGPFTSKMLTTDQVKQGFNELAAAQPSDLADTTTGALAQLGASRSVRGAPYSAVATTEVDLYRRNAGLDGQQATRPLSEVTAFGPSPAADFPFVALAGTGVDQVQIRASQAFREFLAEPDQQHDFAVAGLRVPGFADHPNGVPGMGWQSPSTALTPADPGTTQQITAAWRNLADGGQIVTVLVDVSRSMTADGGRGRSRIDWVRTALNSLADWTVSGSLGLWEFSSDLPGGEPYRQLVPTLPVSGQRMALHQGVTQLQPVGATHLYSSVEAVYRSAQQTYVDGKRNRIVVITDGASDGGISYQQLRTDLGSLANSRKPIQISFITIGAEPDRAELENVAALTRGDISSLTDAQGTSAALAQILSSTDWT